MRKSTSNGKCLCPVWFLDLIKYIVNNRLTRSTNNDYWMKWSFKSCMYFSITHSVCEYEALEALTVFAAVKWTYFLIWGAVEQFWYTMGAMVPQRLETASIYSLLGRYCFYCIGLIMWRYTIYKYTHCTAYYSQSRDNVVARTPACLSDGCGLDFGADVELKTNNWPWPSA